MQNFLQTFYQEKGNFEFVLSNHSISKILFWSETHENNIKIYQYISLFQIDIYNKHKESISFLFERFSSIPIHLGYDTLSRRLKIYIGLYQNDFKSSLQIINQIKKYLNINEKYFLESNFLKFDCIGIDFSLQATDLKIYELLQKKDNKKYMSIVDNTDIKEIGVLKNHNGRKKQFYRFGNYQDISVFGDEIQLSMLDDFQREIKDFNVLQKRVKYYCSEGNKTEIYFI